MSDSKELANERNQQVKIQCIDYATRIVGKPAYIPGEDRRVEKHKDDVIEVAKRMHDFVIGKE